MIAQIETDIPETCNLQPEPNLLSQIFSIPVIFAPCEN
jgi:hypothetical protein